MDPHGQRAGPAEGLEGPWVVGAPDLRPAETTRGRITQRLRDEILMGDRRAGDRIDLDLVAAECGTSRTPVREACLALMGEGLVRVTPRSGVHVLGIGQREILDSFTLMARLAGIAAEWAAERASAEQLGRIADLESATARAAADGGDLAEQNWRFHAEINRACASPRLAALLVDVGRMIPRSFFDLFPEHVPCSLAEHQDIVRALFRRDGPAARSATERHFDG
ncbi:GntR family transcriptional regulator, partial [Pseudonocardia sp. KRD-188]